MSLKIVNIESGLTNRILNPDANPIMDIGVD